MTPEKRIIPNWARLERAADLHWVGENLHVFWSTAKEAYGAHGRGALIVDTTSQPIVEGHPFGYFPQEIIDQLGDEDTKRMIREYDPEKEFVILLLKSSERTSTYRVGSRHRNG